MLCDRQLKSPATISRQLGLLSCIASGLFPVPILYPYAAGQWHRRMAGELTFLGITKRLQVNHEDDEVIAREEDLIGR